MISTVKLYAITPYPLLSSYQCFFLIGKQTNILEWGKPKRAPQMSRLEVYKGAENDTKGGLRQKTTNPPQKLHRTQQASYKGKVHIRNHSFPCTKNLKKKDFCLSNENCMSSNTTLFLSIQIAHNKHRGAARHSFASFFLRGSRTQSSLTR